MDLIAYWQKMVAPYLRARFGQDEKGASLVEYALLVVALVVAVCLLVRFATPVTDVARAVAHAVSHRPAHHRPHAPIGKRRPPHRRPAPCLCPFAAPPDGSSS